MKGTKTQMKTINNYGKGYPSFHNLAPHKNTNASIHGLHSKPRYLKS